MAQEVDGTLRVTISFDGEKDYGITDQKAKAGVSLSKTHTLSGADELYHKSGSLADDANIELDLLTILNAYGAAINLQKVMGVYIANTVAAGGASLLIGGAAANAWSAVFADPTDKIKLPPNSAIILPCVAGLTVDGTHKVLKLTHDGTGTADLTYEIVVVGEGA